MSRHVFQHIEPSFALLLTAAGFVELDDLHQQRIIEIGDWRIIECYMAVLADAYAGDVNLSALQQIAVPVALGSKIGGFSTQQVVLLRDRRSRFLFCTAQNKIKRYPFPFNIFRRNALRASDAAVAVCEEAQDVLERQGFDKPIHVLPLGVDTASFVPSAERRENGRRKFGLDGFVVGYVGRLTAAKGIFDLLGALARVGPDFRLLVIGDGPDKESFLRCAEQLGLAGRVTLTGVVPHSDVPGVLPAMDAMVLPSHTTRTWKEQFGRVLIEAMACGVPVVGSDSGEIPQTIGEAGLVFPEKDQAALADALARLHASRELRDSLAKKGAARARTFSWGAVARQLGGIFRQVLGARAPAGGLPLAA